MVFTTALFIATAALAMWVDRRAPRLAPRRLFWRALLLGASLLVCGYAPVATDSYLTMYGSVFGLLAPLLIVLWLSTLWLLRGAIEALESRYY
jgi:hypothetical protein